MARRIEGDAVMAENYDSERASLRESSRTVRVIDMRLPLTYLLSGAASIAILIAGMYFKLAQLGEDMAEVKISIKAGNSQSASLQGEQAILRFRMENIEGDMRAIKGAQSGRPAENAPAPMYPNPATRRTP